MVDRPQLHLNWPAADAAGGSAPAARELAALPLVEGGEGAELLLSLVRADGSRVSVVLGSAEAVAIADDLLQAVRARNGRGDWPARAAALLVADGAGEGPATSPGAGVR
jgi:hypothetical protein